MDHAHADHHHSPVLKQAGRAFVAGILLNLLFVAVELGFGFYSGSLALLSDAGHNLSDVATLALSLLAFRMARKKPGGKYTYGYSKSTILASLVNAIILLLAVGSIGWEAIQRFIHPVPASGGIMSLVAGIGIVVNAISALFFFRQKDIDLNIKGAYLHLVADALVSAGVVVAGLVISLTQLSWIDPLVSLVIMIVVVYSAWGLLAESLRLSLDAVPAGIDPDEIKAAILKITGVLSVYHIHIWAISTTRNALTAHLVLDEHLSGAQICGLKKEVRHALEHLGVQHATLETEVKAFAERNC